MAFFSVDDLAQLKRDLESVAFKRNALQQQYLQLDFGNVRAKEFALNGYLRQLKTLSRCTERVFLLIPPDCDAPVDDDVRIDAEINIQCSIFNVFGAVDNLAWIWVHEKEVRQSNGSELPPAWVGLRATNSVVRESLPPNFRGYVVGLDDWFNAVDDYRHALAHRIPLYVPPFCVDPKHEGQFLDLDKRQKQALMHGDFSEHQRLKAEQGELQHFKPMMVHSFGEQTRPMVFHAQLLANFNTIEEMGRKFLEALDA